jgi:hypothetical protein
MARGRSGGISQFIELVGQEQVREGFLSLGKIGEQSMLRISTATEKTARSFDQLKGGLKGIAAFEGLRRGVGILGDVTSQMQELRNVAAGTQFPIDTLRAFQIALEQTGNAGEKVGGAFIQFAGAVADADRAAAGADNAFTALGINTKSVQGVDRLNRLLDIYVKRWAQIKQIKPAVAARSGALAFGEDDINKFGKALELASQVGIPKFVEAMKQFGRFPTRADFANMEQYETALGRFRGVINSIKMDAVIALFPGLTQALDKARATLGTFTTDIQRFFVDINRVLTGRKAQTEFVRNLVAMKDVVLFVLGIMKTAFDAFAKGLDVVAVAANNLFGTQWTGKGIAMALVALKLVGAFTALTTAFTLARTAWTLLSTAFVFSPIGALVTSVGLLVAYLLSGTDAAKKFMDQLGLAGPAADQTAAATQQTAQNMGDVATNTRSAAKAADEVRDLTQRTTAQTAALGAATADAAAKTTRFANSAMTIPASDTTDTGPHDMDWHMAHRHIATRTFDEVNPEQVDMATGAKMPIGQGITGPGGNRWVDVKSALGATTAAGFGAAASLNAVAGAADTAAAAQTKSANAAEKAADQAPGSFRATSDQFKQTVDDRVAAAADAVKNAPMAFGGELSSGTAAPGVVSPLAEAIRQAFAGAPAPFGGEASSGTAAPAIDALEQSADSVAASMQGASDQTGSFSGALTAVTDALNSAAAAIAEATSKATLPGMATGGIVPGSGTGDSVAAMLTPGEFVMRRSIVSQLGVPFLSMLNRGAGSFLPRGHYAAGGLVAAGAGAGGTPVHLHLDGKSFALRGGADVVSSLAHEARRYALRSAGTKPSWYGGTPGGR